MRGLTRIASFFAFISCFWAVAQNQIKADSIKSLIGSKNLSNQELLDAYYSLSTFSSSTEEKLEFGQKLLDLAENERNEEYISRGYCKIGIAYRFKGELDTALEYLFRSADLADDSDNLSSLLGEIYAEISTCYTQNGDSENALLYGSKNIALLRKTDKRQELALSLLNVGYDYYLIGNYDSAMTYYNESEPILEEIGMELGIAYIIGNRALVYWKNGDAEKAKSELFKAIDMLEPLGDRYGMADFYNQLGAIYLEEKATEEAILYTTKGLEMAKSEGLKEQVRDASYLLYQLNLEKGDYQNALLYESQYYAYKDSIQNLETTQRLADLRTEYEVGKKQAEVDLLLEQKRSNRIIMTIGAAVLIVFIILIVIIYVSFKSKARLSRQLEQQKDDLVSLNDTKDKFFSIVSHDLRGPVNTLGGLVTVSNIFIKEDRIDELKDMLPQMGASVDRLTQLLDNLLNWALQQRGHFPYSPEDQDLGMLVNNVVLMFKDTAASKNISLNSDLQETNAYVDKNSTSTILRNLVNNAIKFTNEGGEVNVTTESDIPNNTCIIRISDTGVGIPEDKLDQLFNLKENVSSKGTSGEMGLGLGLILVKEFVQLNNGSISVESKSGSGTTFTIKLPLKATS